MELVMKILPLLLLVLLASCTSDKKKIPDASEDGVMIEQEIADFYQSLKRAYHGVPINTDSLIDDFFGKDVYYVTYWGTTEPIDTTKSRLRHAVSGIKDYENRVEGVTVKVYGDGAYAFFILRQTYTLNGVPMDEYLPTTFIFERRDKQWVVVHSHRSTDVQTIQQYMNVSQRQEAQAASVKK